MNNKNIKSKLDGEEFRLLTSKIEPEKLGARQLLDQIVNLETFIATLDMLKIYEEKLPPDYEVGLASARTALKRLYSEVDRRYFDFNY